MNEPPPPPLQTLLAGMQRAGLDVGVYGLLDAFWLALQPGFRLDVASPGETNLPPTEIPNYQGQLPLPPGPPPAPESGKRQAPEPLQKTAEEDEEKVDEKVGIFEAGAGEDEKQTSPASPLRIPAASALAEKLPLARSMRPLRRLFKNPLILELDEEATVDATAEAGGMLMPVLRPRSERWYELVIVSDSVPSMDVWFETMLEFEQLARTAGSFRDVRCCQLRWTEPPRLSVGLEEMGATLLNAKAVPVPAATLAQTNARRLVLVATNGTAEHWTDGRMAALLNLWGKQCLIVILHMLPERFWHQSRIGEPELLVTTLSPGSPAASLDAMPGWWDDELTDAEGNLIRRVPGAIPILPLDQRWMGRWARLSYGACRVTIPRSHQLGKVESRNLIKLQFRDDPEKHITLAGLDPLPQALFEGQLSRVGDAENAGVLIYVHGYNYDFRGAALRCAQIYWDIGLSVIPLLYSWPSQGTATGYLKDQAAAAWTGSHLKDLIARLLKATPVRNLHLLAEGLGCSAVASALGMLRTEMTSLGQLQVIFAYAEIDVDSFKETAAAVAPLLRGFTVYVSTEDKALDLSTQLSGSPLAGSSIQVIPGVDTIDVSADAKGLFDPRLTSAMLSDIYSVMRGIVPDQRFGLSRVVTSQGSHWALNGKLGTTSARSSSSLTE